MKKAKGRAFAWKIRAYILCKIKDTKLKINAAKRARVTVAFSIFLLSVYDHRDIPYKKDAF